MAGQILLQSYQWRRVPLEELIVVRIVKNLPEFYGTQRFITTFTRARYWSLLSQMHPFHTLTWRILKLQMIPDMEGSYECIV
jgi:hypothetical protein